MLKHWMAAPSAVVLMLAAGSLSAQTVTAPGVEIRAGNGAAVVTAPGAKVRAGAGASVSAKSGSVGAAAAVPSPPPANRLPQAPRRLRAASMSTPICQARTLPGLIFPAIVL